MDFLRQTDISFTIGISSHLENMFTVRRSDNNECNLKFLPACFASRVQHRLFQTSLKCHPSSLPYPAEVRKRGRMTFQTNFRHIRKGTLSAPLNQSIDGPYSIDRSLVSQPVCLSVSLSVGRSVSDELSFNFTGLISLLKYIYIHI